jgi:hypothetical protein
MLLGQESSFQKERVAPSIAEAAATLRRHRGDLRNYWRSARPEEPPPNPGRLWVQP